MQYFVIWPNGQRFGPANLATLQDWLRENRIDANTDLEEAGTGRKLKAGALLGLQGGSTQYQQPPDPSAGQSYSGYYRPTPTSGMSHPLQSSGGNTEITLAWIFGVLGLFLGLCCPLFSVIGLVMALIAQTKRQANAVAAIVLNAIGIAIYLGAMFFGAVIG